MKEGQGWKSRQELEAGTGPQRSSDCCLVLSSLLSLLLHPAQDHLLRGSTDFPLQFRKMMMDQSYGGMLSREATLPRKL